MAGPTRAQAQGGLGLDLSGDPPKPEASPNTSESNTESSGDAPMMDPGALGGLDLRDDVPSAELLPHWVLVGLDTSDKAGAAASKNWLATLVRAARDTKQVALGASFKDVKERLGDNYDAALRCAEAACMAEPADTLDAELLVTARLVREGKQWALHLWTYDRDHNTVAEDVLTGRNPRDAKFMRSAAEAVAKRVQELGRQRAKLKVSVNVPQAVVRLGDKTLGVGNIEARLPPSSGEVKVSVEADEYSAFSKMVTLNSGETVTVDARLELNGPAPDGPPQDEALKVASKKKSSGPSKPSIFKRPALYTAVVGLAAVGVGVAMGLQAKSVNDRARDANGDGVLDVTRREVQDAQSKASLATILMAGGGVVAGGSLVWLALVPTQSAPKPTVTGASGKGASSTAFHLFAGGSF